MRGCTPVGCWDIGCPAHGQIEYKGKGYFSGKSHTYKATVTPPGSNNIAHTFEGQWNGVSKNVKTGAVFTDVSGGKEEVRGLFFDSFYFLLGWLVAVERLLVVAHAVVGWVYASSPCYIRTGLSICVPSAFILFALAAPHKLTGFAHR